MATRCNIGKRLSDGSIKYIYCHFDGYERGVGATLKQHYTDENKIDELLNLGDLSILGAEIGSKQEFNNRNKQQSWCLAYGRDRGEKNIDATITNNFDDFMVHDYAYLYENSEWVTYKN
jgi:hypothetical protein